MNGLEDVHDDEIRARLGMKPVDRPETMEERIEANMVRAIARNPWATWSSVPKSIRLSAALMVPSLIGRLKERAPGNT